MASGAVRHAPHRVMVLVDTSVWIRPFANRAPFTEELGRLLELDEVASHDLIYGELLISDRQRT